MAKILLIVARTTFRFLRLASLPCALALAITMNLAPTKAWSISSEDSELLDQAEMNSAQELHDLQAEDLERERSRVPAEIVVLPESAPQEQPAGQQASESQPSNF